MRRNFRKLSIIVIATIWISILSSIIISNSEQTFIKNTNSEASITLQKYYEGLDISYIVAGPNSNNKDVLDIVAEVRDNDSKSLISEDDMEVNKYHVYRDEKGDEEVLSGNLKYDSDNKEWSVKGINLFWKGNGKFYVTVEFQTKDMDESVETDTSDDSKYMYTRANVLEPILEVVIVIGTIIGVVVLIIFIRAKRQGISVERKVKESKEEVKIQEISKDDLKVAKKKEKKKEETKGKTEAKEDLIFSVPKWESDDDKEEKK